MVSGYLNISLLLAFIAPIIAKITAITPKVIKAKIPTIRRISIALIEIINIKIKNLVVCFKNLIKFTKINIYGISQN